MVVVVSDGWERDDPRASPSRCAASTRSMAHHVVWANPHRGHDAYQPVQRSIVAALPYVDSFVAGHSMTAFAELLEVVEHA